MAKTLQHIWPDGWPQVCYDVGRIESDYERANMEKIFKRAYLEQWKRRDGLPADVHFKGANEIAISTNDDDAIHIDYVETYTVVDGAVKLLERIRVTRPKPQPCPMPPEIREPFERLFGKMGKDGKPETFNPFRNQVTGDALDPAVPGSQNRPVTSWRYDDNPTY
jgi:hypothetical protein